MSAGENHCNQSRGIYQLESREQAVSTGEKQSNKAEAPTSWKAQDGQSHKGGNKGIQKRHLQTREQRTDNVSIGQTTNQPGALTS